MSWFDLLKNIQIASQMTGSKNYVKPDESDDCLRKLLNLSDEYMKLQRVINWRYYLDTYLNSGDLAITSDFQDPIMEESWPSKYGLSEDVLCFWVKHLSEIERSLKNDYTGYASKSHSNGKNYFFYADFFEYEDKGKKCVRIKIRLISNKPERFYSTFNITGPSHKEIIDFIRRAVS